MLIRISAPLATSFSMGSSRYSRCGQKSASFQMSSQIEMPSRRPPSSTQATSVAGSKYRHSSNTS